MDSQESLTNYPLSNGDIMSRLNDLTERFDQLQSNFDDLSQKFETIAFKFCHSDGGLYKLEEEVAELRRDLTALQEWSGRQDSEIADRWPTLSQDLAELQGDNARLRSDLEKTVASLKTQDERLTRQMTLVQWASTVLHNEVRSSEERLRQLEWRASTNEASLRVGSETITKLETQIAHSSRQVSFCAFLTEDTQSRQDSDDPIRAQAAECHGGGYDSCTGVFTVPVSGLYLLLARIAPAARGERADSHLSVNGVPVSWLHCFDYDSPSSDHVVARLQTGDKVCLRADKKVDCSFAANGFTTFSGVLVCPSPVVQ